MKLDKTLNAPAHPSDSVDDDVEILFPNPDTPPLARFEAGHGDAQHQTHQQIERALLELDLSRYELDAIYFGNWLRDYSQLVDPKVVRAPGMDKHFPEVLSREALTRIVDVLSIKHFPQLRKNAALHHTVTPEKLGVYRPSEHLDNPRTDDLDTPDPRLRDPQFEALVFPGDPLLDIDYDTSMKRYLGRSVDFMTSELQRAMTLKRSPAGLSAFGSALHVLEDFFAHSNFVELALIKNGHEAVLPWTSPAHCKAGLPLVTGTFGASDTLASLIGPLGALLFSPRDLIYQPTKAGDRSEREQILLILLAEHQNPRYLDIYQTYLETRDQWVELPLVEFFQRSAKYLEGLYAVVGNATGIVMKDLLIQFSENIDDWQTRYGADPHENGSTDPTHSQLAKDHAEHPLHSIAAALAFEAVRKVGEAMVAYWNGDAEADPIATAVSYFTHPQNSDWQDAQVTDWAAANPEAVRFSTSKEEMLSISEKVAQSGRRALNQMEKDGAAYLDFLRGEIMDPHSPYWVLLNLTPQGSLLRLALEKLGFFRK